MLEVEQHFGVYSWARNTAEAYRTRTHKKKKIRLTTILAHVCIFFKIILLSLLVTSNCNLTSDMTNGHELNVLDICSLLVAVSHFKIL